MSRNRIIFNAKLIRRYCYCYCCFCSSPPREDVYARVYQAQTATPTSSQFVADVLPAVHWNQCIHVLLRDHLPKSWFQ